MRARYPDEEGYVERDGVRLFYEVYGDGEPTFLLLPTWSIIHSRFWKAQIPYLARHHRVVTFDGRGNGRSDRPQDPAAYAPNEFGADALAVLDAHGFERAWMIGHSWGGHLALHLAAARPDRVAGVICIDALGAYAEVFGETGERLLAGLTPAQRGRVHEIEDARRRGEADEADLVERMGLIWPQYFAEPARATPAPERVGAECSTQTNASLTDHFAAGTLANGLPGVTVQVAFVHGELDPLPPRSSLDTAALVPGARTEIIPGVGHFPWLERPGSVRTALEALAIG
jgi:pimeloyl-ACP methyl ester carboxylesterase